MNKVFISNTCVGQSVNRILDNTIPYNNPFIGTLIPNDLDYIKLVNNLEYYTYLDATLGLPKEDSVFCNQNNGKWYKHQYVSIPYPVIYLGDIEIHCIHEDNYDNCFNKFNRRLHRLREVIKLEHKIFCLFSFSEFLNNHDDNEKIIESFLINNKSNLNIIKLFLGPSKYNIDNNDNYINVNEWNNIELIRDSSNVYKFNDQIFNVNQFYNKIINL